MKIPLFLMALVLLFMNGCSSSSVDKKTEDIGRLKQEIVELENQNAQLKKDVAKKHIVVEGKKFFFIHIYLLLLIINNAVWFIIYRRK